MKKIFCLIISVFAIFGNVFSQTVSESEARSLGAGFMQKNAHKSALKAADMETVSTVRLKNGAPAYFVLQPSDGAGFVILAANRASQPVLGFSATDSFDPQNLPPAMQYLLDTYKSELDMISLHRLTPDAEISQAWEKLSETEQPDGPASIVVAPLLQTTWDQSPLYNNQCPNGGSLTGASAPTGCVATAMAQLMYYWSFPITNQTVAATDVDNNNVNHIAGTFSAQVGGGYNWGNMQLALTGTSSPTQVNEIANLMYDCGVAAKMDYGVDESSAFAVNAAAAMDNLFGYGSCPVYYKSSYTSYQWLDLLKNNLNQGKPMYYGGDNAPVPAGQTVTGHAWVVDGYMDNNLFHMNWGWGGRQNNIYFPLTGLNPTLSNGTVVNLNNHQHMFVPVPQGSCTPFALLSGVQTNSNVEVAHWISASCTLPGSIPVSFNAHDVIILTNGFTAAQGTDFHAFILGCDGNLEDPATDERTQEVAVTPVSAGEKISIAPNPFTGSTTVTYSLPNEQQVALQLFDAQGNLVATPLSAQIQPEGKHQFQLEAGHLPAGMYFLVMQSGDKEETKRLVLTQ